MPDPVPAARRLAARARRRVLTLARRHPNASAAELSARAAAELRAVAPELARVLTPALVAGWLDSARKLARSAAPVVVGAHTLPPIPPPPDLPPIPLADVPEPRPPVRWPAIEAAAKDLAARKVLTWPEYQTIGNQAKAAAFSVARVLTEDAVTEVRDAIGRAVTEGRTLKQFRAEVAPAIEGSGLSESQVETVFRTQLGQAQAAGMRKLLNNPVVSPEFPYVAWEGILDSRIRPQHRMMMSLGIQGTNIFRRDDPELRVWWAPVGWNCRCFMRVLTAEDAAAAGIREAAVYLRTGVWPDPPAWVKPIPFAPPKGWPRNDGGIAPVLAG